MKVSVDLSPPDLAIVERILAEHVPACEVRAFGSRATWNAKDYSDLDLAVVGEGPLSRGALARIKEAFEESRLPMRVDVVDWHSIAVGFREAIESDCVVVQERTLPRIKDEWPEMSLGEVVELKRGYDLPKRDRSPGPVPLVSSSGITDHHAEAKVKGPGVVTGRYGTLGEVFFIPSEFWPLNTTLYVRDFKGNDPRFISYFLRTLDFFAYSDKAAVPGLNRNHLHQEIVRLPSLKEQRAIARVLGALDDRIELNRRMSETLEEMARALFRSWFVDFDPVRAKAEGRPSGLPPDVDELFPVSFQASELGAIPAGWEVKTLGDVAQTIRGRSYRSVELAESDTALVTLKSFSRGGGYRPDGLKAYTGRYRPEQVVRPGELVIACTDVTQAAEVVGRPAIVQPNAQFETLVASLDTLIVRPYNSSVEMVPFLYCLGRTPSFTHHTYSHVSGTTVLHLAKDAVASYQFPTAPRGVLSAFNSLVEPVFSRLTDSWPTADVIRNLRDSLLPRLVSGELRVGGV